MKVTRAKTRKNRKRTYDLGWRNRSAMMKAHKLNYKSALDCVLFKVCPENFF